MEKAVEHNLIGGMTNRTLAMSYANAGRVEEGKAMFAKHIENYPELLKNVRWFLSVWSFKDIRVLEQIAEGYTKPLRGSSLIPSS